MMLRFRRANHALGVACIGSPFPPLNRKSGFRTVARDGGMVACVLNAAFIVPTLIERLRDLDADPVARCIRSQSELPAVQGPRLPPPAMLSGIPAR